MAAKTDPRVTKRRVDLSGPRPFRGVDGKWEIPHDSAVADYVRPDILAAYVADSRLRWEHVTVSDEPDAGPGGYHGQTFVPHTLEHELAGQTFAATTPLHGPDATALWAPDGSLALEDWDVERLLTLHRETFGDTTMWLTTFIKDFVNKTGSYAAACAFVALVNATPTATAGTEVSTSRLATAWGSTTNGVMSTGPHALSVNSGSTVAGFQFHTLATAGSYCDGGSLASQAFASNGTYSVTVTETTG